MVFKAYQKVSFFMLSCVMHGLWFGFDDSEENSSLQSALKMALKMVWFGFV